MAKPKPVVLCILDGWGHSDSPENNAIQAANTPNYQRFLKEWPHSFLETSGLDVGLPRGQMGNSEVGHMTIGSGRVVMQELPKIDIAIEDGTLAKKQAIDNLCTKLKNSGNACHLLGLCSDGGVHAHIDHIIALAKIVSGKGVKVYLHIITDGRDTPTNSGLAFVQKIEKELSADKNIQIATVSGRYYAMDRDKRWERVELAYNAIISGEGKKFANATEVLKQSHADNKTDEFILPAVIEGYSGAANGDGLIMANFRADRARQILETILLDNFDGFRRKKIVKFSSALGMVVYSETLNTVIETIFKSEKMTNILPEIVSNSGLRQLRIAETEKYAHVTFFFSGGREKEFNGEERVLVPSPKVATYDLKPEMSAPEVTDKLIQAIESDKFDFIVVNFANTDMVGHTGDLQAAIKAVEQVDKSIGMVAEAVLKKDGVMLITADHGNAEEMYDEANAGPHTQHTLNPVPFVLIGTKDIKLKDGSLADIAPTILELINLPKPQEMNGNSLLN